MSSFSEDIIRETFEKLGDAIGVQMQMSDAMITNLGAVLQAQIDLLAELQSAGRLVSAGGMALTAEQVEDVRRVLDNFGRHSITSDMTTAAERLADALFPATEPAEEAKPCGSNSVTLGWCKLTARHEGLHTNGTYLWGTPSEPDPPAPAEPAEEETKAEPSTRQIADVIVEGRSQNMSWMQIAEMVKQVFFPASSPVVPAPTEAGPWEDWPSLDAIPADVRTVWDKSGDEYRRENGGWKFRSPGGKWQQITLPLDDYIDYAPFTTAAVAVWDPELGTRNDWTLNEGAEQ